MSLWVIHTDAIGCIVLMCCSSPILGGPTYITGCFPVSVQLHSKNVSTVKTFVMGHTNHSGKTCGKLHRLSAPPSSVRIVDLCSWKCLKPYNCNNTSVNMEETQVWIVFPYVFPEWFACHITMNFAILTVQLYCVYLNELTPTLSALATWITRVNTHLPQQGLLNPALHYPGKLRIAIHIQVCCDDWRTDCLRGIDNLLNSRHPQCDMCTLSRKLLCPHLHLNNNWGLYRW